MSCPPLLLLGGLYQSLFYLQKIPVQSRGKYSGECNLHDQNQYKNEYYFTQTCVVSIAAPWGWVFTWATTMHKNSLCKVLPNIQVSVTCTIKFSSKLIIKLHKMKLMSSSPLSTCACSLTKRLPSLYVCLHCLCCLCPWCFLASSPGCNCVDQMPSIKDDPSATASPQMCQAKLWPTSNPFICKQMMLAVVMALQRDHFIG